MKRLASVGLAGLCALCARPAAAQGGQRTGDAAVTGPMVSGPSVNLTPNVNANPNLGLAPGGLDVNLSIPGQAVNPGGTAVGATPTAQSAQNRGANPTSPTATNVTFQQGLGQTPAAQQNRPGAQVRGANARPADPRATGPKVLAAPDRKAPPATGTGLDASVMQIKKAETAEESAGGGDGLGLSSALKKVFDAEVAAGNLAPGPTRPSSVRGKTQDAADAIMHKASGAEQAAPQEAAANYADAIKAATEAGMTQAAGTILSYAGKRAQSALAQIVGSAYAAAEKGSSAAGEREVKRAFKGLDAWETLLGRPGAPLLRNAARVKADVARVQQAASRPGAAVEAPSVPVKADPAGGFFADLPGSQVARIAASELRFELTSDPTAALTDSWLDDVLVAHGRNPGAEPGVLFRIARRGAQRAAVAAAASAAQLTFRSLLARFWHWLKSLVASAFGRTDALASIRREPTTEEKAAAGSDAPLALDLARLNGPYIEAQQAQAPKAQIAAARRLAAAHESVTGDASGRTTLEKLLSRLPAEGKLSATDQKLLSYWIERLHASALGAVLEPLAERSGSAPVVFFDLTGGSGMVGVVGSGLNSEALARAGFDVRGAAAVFGPGGSRAELTAALDAALGRGAQAAPSSAPTALAKALAFASAKPREAEAAAAAIQAELAASPLSFATLGRVRAEGGDLTVSLAVRKRARLSEELYLLSQPATGRVYGFKAAAAR